MIKLALAAVIAALCLATNIDVARSDDLPCVGTTFRFIGKNDRVCISAFDDLKVPGVACHIRSGKNRWAQRHDWPCRRSLTVLDCVLQVGPITVHLATLTDGEEVYSVRTSIFFKRTHVYRVLDKKRNTLVYLAHKRQAD